MKTRLVLYEPAGSPNCPSNLPQGCFNTGLLEGCVDPQQFDARYPEQLINYTNEHGEAIKRVSNADEALTLCKAWQAPVNVVPPPQSITQGGARPQDIAPSATPPPMGGAVGGPSAITDTPTERSFKMGEIYRLIILSANGKYDTGATYPSCHISNPDGCKPVQFNSEQDAIDYALQNGEIPVRVNSVQEAWDIVEGKIAIQESSILGQGFDTMTLLAIGAAAVFVLPMLLKKKGGKPSTSGAGI